MDDRPLCALLVPWLNKPNLFGLTELIPLPFKLDYSFSGSSDPTKSPYAFLFPSFVFKTPKPGVTLAASPGPVRSSAPSCRTACVMSSSTSRASDEFLVNLLPPAMDSPPLKAATSNDLPMYNSISDATKKDIALYCKSSGENAIHIIPLVKNQLRFRAFTADY
ncbi:hypothetical protein CFP56_007656 [Quercus suber]|uniref:Uncharacterized protein n=1 Tax=Quercus suber TaxID=58331 RepID=A0AAW0L5P4_QUESU